MDDKIKSRLFNEINFELLRSQSNIYGVSTFKNPASLSNKLLVSLLEGRIFMWEYVKPQKDEMKCVNKEVTFTYIPGKCHIISIDSFSCAARGLIVGVTFCKESSENFLNIYCSYGDDVPKGQEWNIDHVAQNCRSFALSFTPFQLTHCKVKSSECEESNTVFVLLGSDCCFHVYAQCISNDEFTNVSSSDYLPELAGNYGIPTYLEVHNTDKNRRVSVIGNTIGGITIFSVDILSNTVKSSWSIQHDSPISQCCFFYENDALHLAVVSARELAVIYRDVLNNGVKEQILLEGSDSYDVVTSCAIADINYDGIDEIIVGTYGSEVLAYSFDPANDVKSLQPIWSRKFSAPVLKVKLFDFTGDGVNEMVVVTINGIHILQPDLTTLLNLCKSKLNEKPMTR